MMFNNPVFEVDVMRSCMLDRVLDFMKKFDINIFILHKEKREGKSLTYNMQASRSYMVNCNYIEILRCIAIYYIEIEMYSYLFITEG